MQRCQLICTSSPQLREMVTEDAEQNLDILICRARGRQNLLNNFLVTPTSMTRAVVQLTGTSSPQQLNIAIDDDRPINATYCDMNLNAKWVRYLAEFELRCSSLALRRTHRSPSISILPLGTGIAPNPDAQESDLRKSAGLSSMRCGQGTPNAAKAQHL